MIVLVVTYKGFDNDQDIWIERLIGQYGGRALGSGYGLGVRDLDFSFENASKAKSACDEINGIVGVTAAIEDWDDDDNMEVS